MAIQVRRGNEADFDASKMLPGEWAVSLDTRYVRMCFAPGLVLRMAIYESFEADMAQIQAILAECKTIQSAVQRIQAEVNSKASLVIENANFAKESANRAYNEAERAKAYANNAEAVTGVNIATQDRAGLVKGGDNYIAEDGTLTLIKQTTAFTMPNSYSGRLLVEEIGGVCEQDTTTGKNLWSYGDIPTGTASSISWDIPAETYTFSTPTTAFDLTLRVYFEDGSNKVISLTKSPITFTLENDVVSFNYNSIKESTVANIQVEAGTVATAYEPYTGGIPSPNPSYPQEIKKTVVSEIRTHGKNLANFQNDKNTNRGKFTYTKETPEKIVATKNADNCFVARFEAGLKANTSYHISLTESNWIVFIYYNDLWGEFYTSFEGNGKTITVPKDGTYVIGVFIGTSVAVGGTVTVSNFQIEEGKVATEYEPYTESLITLSQPIDLYGIGDVQDVITQKDGSWGIERNVLHQKLSLDSKSSNDYGCTFFGSVSNRPFIGVGKYDAFLCTHLKCLNEIVWNPTDIDYPCMSAGTHVKGQSGNANVFFPISYGIDTVEKFNQWATDNNVMLLGPKAPTFEALPIADQIALNSLATYDGITYLEFDSEIEPTFKGEYGTSKVGGYALEGMLAGRNGELYGSRISALEASVVNNI